MNRLNPALPGKQRVERAAKCGARVQLGWGAEAHSLADRMHACIGAAGRMGRGSAAEEALENPLEFGLYRATCRLALPPDKAGAVVVKRGEEGPAHGPESSLAGTTRASYATACHD